MALQNRAGLRHLLKHPLQLFLALLGVALGVAVVISVDLASESARRSFSQSVENISGKTTHQIIGGSHAIDEAFYVKLRVDEGITSIAPVVEAYGRTDKETFHLFGVDPFAEGEFRSHLGRGAGFDLKKLLTKPGTVLMSRRKSTSMGLAEGDKFQFQAGSTRTLLEIAGFIPQRAQGEAVTENLLIADISTAQEVTGLVGKLSSIDMIVPKDKKGEAFLEKISKALPPDAKIVSASSRRQTMDEMTKAFRTNLAAMSFLALLVGAFLIYNTMTFSILQRRQLIGSLRILGVTREAIFKMVMAEAFLIALVGTVCGVAIGILLGTGLVKLVTRTINDLYFVLSVDELFIAPLSLIKGALVGLAASIVAALVPAWEAARVSPSAAVKRSVIEGKAVRVAPKLAGAGAFLILLSLLILNNGGRSLLAGFTALFMVILGMIFFAPYLTSKGVKVMNLLPSSLLGLEVRLAVRGIGAALSRTGVAIAVLMLAVSTTVGVGVMIDSFRHSVKSWLESIVQADIYMRSHSFKSKTISSSLDPQFVEKLVTIKGVAGTGTSQWITLQTKEGLTEVHITDIWRKDSPPFLIKEGDNNLWQNFFNNEAVIVSEPYANMHGTKVGHKIELPTDYGPRLFAVAGIFYDYDSGPGVVLINRALYNEHFKDRSVRSVGLYLKEGARAEKVMKEVRAMLPPGQTIEMRRNGEIRERSLAIFDRTFTITSVLRLLAVVIAFIGVLSTMMALQMERAREMAILRATGFVPAQVAGLIITQTGLMGLMAGVLAIPSGLVMAHMLIHVINERSFGWTMETVISVPILFEAILLALTAALLAGIYPAWRISRAMPVEAMREE